MIDKKELVLLIRKAETVAKHFYTGNSSYTKIFVDGIAEIAIEVVFESYSHGDTDTQEFCFSFEELFLTEEELIEKYTKKFKEEKEKRRLEDIEREKELNEKKNSADYKKFLELKKKFENNYLPF